MKIISLSSLQTEIITLFNSSNCSSYHLSEGQGTSHTYYMNFQQDSLIGPHVAGFDQLFLVISGSGWVAGKDDCPQEISAGQVAYFKKGERHSKGSEAGMMVMMLQFELLNLNSDLHKLFNAF